MKSAAVRYSLSSLFVSVALALLLTVPAQGQVVTGTLSGTVVDPAGAVLPGATVTLTNEGTGSAQKMDASSSGAFHFTLLAIGRYRIQITKPGFTTLQMTGLQVDANVERALGSLALKIGQATESMEVTATPPLVDGAEAQVTTSLTSENIQTFAGVAENEGLDYMALTLPGVAQSRDQNFANTNGVGFSVNGLRGRNNDQQVDGQNNNDNSVTGPSLFLSDPDFVSEYQATTSNFGPEYGRNSGSVINVNTKSGTNRWHGTIFGTETNSILTTFTNFEKENNLKKLPRFNQEFTGGSVGGPLWKDKVFVFGGFDNQISSSQGLFTTGLLSPTASGIAALSSCFPGSTSIQALSSFGPYAVGAGNPTVSPGSTTTAYFDGAPVNNTTDPNTGASACGYQLAGVQRTVPNGSHFYDWVARLDLHLTDTDSFFVRYLFQKSILFNVGANTAQIASGYGVSEPSLGQLGLIDWTHVFSSRLVNEFRIGYGRINVQFGGNTMGNTVPADSNIANALTDITFSNAALLAFGAPNVFPQGRVVNTYQLQDTVAFTKGQHQLKFGANITNQRSPNIFLPNVNGTYVFSDWGAFAANQANSVSITQGNPEFGFKEWDTFVYAGDDWKIKSNLTLNLGLTWSYLGQPGNAFHQKTVAQQTGPNPFWLNSLPLAATTDPAIANNFNLFGPSAGFAWSPDWLGHGKTVLRGGYRLTYDPNFYNIYLLDAISAPVVLAQTLNNPTAGVLANPTGSNVRSEYASSLVAGVSDPRFFNETQTPANFRPDRVHEWSFGIQREVTSDSAFEVRYVGNHAQDLLQSVNANPYIAGLAASYPQLVPAGLSPCTSPLSTDVNMVALGRVSCNNGILDDVLNTGYSNYQGVQAEFRATHIFHQLTLRTNYTYSRTLDNVSEIFSTGAAGNSIAFSQNVLNYQGQEYSRSALDTPNTWTLSFVEDIPLMRSQHGVVGHILGGWSVAGTYIYQSGQPYTPSQEFTNFFSSLASGVPQVNDEAFDSSQVGVFETSRPFLANHSAPATQVGIYAADACADGTTLGNGLALACGIPAATLVSLNSLNAATPTVNTVTGQQVHFIVNGAQADAVFGTPFGSAARNSVRDYQTNFGNFTLYKSFRFNDRASVQWRMAMNNVFNHPNYGSTIPGINPFVENAGLAGQDTTFADPKVTSTAINNCPAGSRCLFFGLKIIY